MPEVPVSTRIFPLNATKGRISSFGDFRPLTLEYIPFAKDIATTRHRLYVRPVVHVHGYGKPRSTLLRYLLAIYTKAPSALQIRYQQAFQRPAVRSENTFLKSLPCIYFWINGYPAMNVNLVVPRIWSEGR